MAAQSELKTSGTVKRILIIKPSSLGDIFHAFPAVALLGQFCPEAEVDWLIHPNFVEALDYSPVPIARRILFRRRELGRPTGFLPEAYRLVTALRAERYDYIFDFQGLLRSALCAFAAHGTVVGFARPRERTARCFYTRTVRVNPRLHAVKRNLLLVERFFRGDDAAEIPETIAAGLSAAPEYARTLDTKLNHAGLPADATLIGVAPGARWISKTFPPALFGAVIDQVAAAAPTAHFVLLGAPADRRTAEAVAQACTVSDRVISLAGATRLGELVEVIRRCKVLIANDSGPVHIAAAAGVPVVGFYGSTEPTLTGPYGPVHEIFQRRELPCIACLKRECPMEPSLACHQLDAARIARSIVEKLQTVPREEKNE